MLLGEAHLSGGGLWLDSRRSMPQLFTPLALLHLRSRALLALGSWLFAGSQAIRGTRPGGSRDILSVNQKQVTRARRLAADAGGNGDAQDVNQSMSDHGNLHAVIYLPRQ